MARNILTDSRYIGGICTKHPEFKGLRIRINYKCVQCDSEDTTRRRAHRKSVDPEYRNKLKAQQRAWISDHPHVKLSVQRKRELAKKNRVPPWADMDKIREVYRKAKESGMVVDHIIPLQGKLVSGLHVHNNLQLLPNSENSSKGNRYDVS